MKPEKNPDPPMIFIVLIGLLMVLVMTVLYVLWLLDMFFGDEDFMTSQEAVQKISQIIVAHDYHHGLLYDLGSCRGGFVLALQKICPSVRVIGIDNSRLRTFFARLAAFFQQRKNSPGFLRANIFNMDVSRVDMVFVYLPRPLLPALEIKLQREMRPGSIAITYRVCFPTWKPSEIFLTDLAAKERNNIFVYQVGLPNAVFHPDNIVGRQFS